MPARLTAIRAERLFDGLGDQPLAARTVVVEGAQIEAVVEGDPALSGDAAVIDAPILAPGFIDMQINGGGDRLFNDEPSADGIATIAAAARRGGTAYILPTFITAKGAAYRQALDAGVPGVLGAHLDRWLAPRRPASAARDISSNVASL